MKAKAGFTGTRRGLTAFQRELLMNHLASRRPAELHHGDCTGADAEAHDLCGALGIPDVAHPPDSPAWRAWTDAAVILPSAPYLDRDLAIVEACDYLIGCPHGPEQLRSGTWATIRYARIAGKPVIIFYPDGRVDNMLVAPVG